MKFFKLSLHRWLLSGLATVIFSGGLVAQTHFISYGPYGGSSAAAALSFHHYDPASNTWQATMTLAVTAGPGTGGATYEPTPLVGLNTTAAAVPISHTAAGLPAGQVFPFGVNVTDAFGFGPGYSEPVAVPGGLTSGGEPNQNRFTTVGGAVQLATGREATRRTLFTFSGARDWDFALSYNSSDASYQLGVATLDVPRGWSHNFASRLAQPVSGGPIYLSDNAYLRYVFTPTGDPTVYTSTADGARYDTLKVQPDGKRLITHRDQSAHLYDTAGRLIEDRDPQGRKLVLAYAGGRIASITDPISGTSLTFTTYSLAGDGSYQYMKTLTDSSGAVVQFDFDATYGGNLSKITNQNGKETVFTYDGISGLATIKDHLNQTIFTNTYNTDGKVIAQTDGRAGVTPLGFVYTATTTTLTDHNGKQSVHTFDASGNTTSFKNPLNQTTTYVYDSANRLTSVTDPLSRTSAYTYDAQGNVLTATDPAGKVTTFTYDARNNLLTTTLPAPAVGQPAPVTTRTYDANNNLLTLQDALGRTTTWTYNSNSLPVTMTLPGGGVYNYTYTSGRLTQVTDPNSVVTNFGYDANGRLLYREDALGKRVTFTYDALGNVLTVKNALNETTTYTYDHRNRVATITDPAGAVTTNTYDHNHNLLTATVTASGLPTLVTTYTYDGENRLKTVTTPDPDTSGTGAGKDPLVTTYNYDDAGRLTSVVAPGGTTAFAYDAAGQLTTVTDPAGKVTTSTYNTRGLLTGVTDPLTRATAIAYDDIGRRKTVTDPLNRVTTLDYDALHRVTKVTDPGSLVAEQGFDLNGNRNSLKNPASAVTAFAYDAGGRPTTATTPEGRATGYTYNSRGLPASVVEPSTQTTTFAYNDAQRLTSTTDPLGTINYGRDSAGRVTTVVEGAKTITRVYDAYDRLTSYTDGDGNVIGYAYDNLGRLKKLTYPGTPVKEVTYAYDAAGRLGSVTDWASRVTAYSYDAVGRVTQLLRPNGTKQTRVYDNAGQLTQLTELAPDGTTVIYSGAHSYDAAGQLTGETILPALAAAIVNTTQTFDADNRLLTHNGAATTFDADGNLLSVASGGTPASYTYDARNRLTSAGGLTYSYNADNRRVSITDGGGTTAYVVNPNAVPDQVLTKTAPGGTKTFYVYGLGLLHEETGGTPRYYHFDRRGDTIALTDSAGAVTGRVAYGVYGEILSQTGTIATPFLFNGKWGVQTDSNGLYYHRARYYHPQLRRFLNQDTVLGSIGDSASLNRFAYANGNPVSLIDPFGLMASDQPATWWNPFSWEKNDWASFLEGGQLGYYAWVDGLTPFADFYSDMGYYDTNDATLAASKFLGGVSQFGATGVVGAAPGLLFKTAGGSATFFTGRGSWHLAQSMGNTINATAGGRMLAGAEAFLGRQFGARMGVETGKALAREAMAPFWEVGSGYFAAANATKNLNVVIGSKLNLSSVFFRIEQPTIQLMRNIGTPLF